MPKIIVDIYSTFRAFDNPCISPVTPVFPTYSYIRATAEVQNPEICLVSSNVFLEEVYVDVPVVKEIVLENKTLLSSNISWKEVSLSGICQGPPEGETRAEPCCIPTYVTRNKIFLLLDLYSRFAVDVWFVAHTKISLTEVSSSNCVTLFTIYSFTYWHVW